MSKQKPVFNGLTIAKKYRQELEQNLTKPVSIQSINNTKNIISEIEGKGSDVSNNKMTPEQFIKWADTRNKEIDKLRQSIGTEYEQQINLEGAGSIVRGEFPVAGSVSGGLFKVINAVSDDKLDTGRKIVDIGLGVAQTGIGLIPSMSVYNMISPLGRPLAMSVSNQITGNPELGGQIYDYGSMLPFGAKVFIASLGSSGVSYGVEKVLNDPESFSGVLSQENIDALKNLSDEDKNRIIEGSHHAGFLGTMWGVGKITKGLELNKEFKKIKDEANLSKVDKQVRDSMNPKLQGEKQIDIRGDKLTQEVVKEKIEQPTQEPKLGDVAELQKPTEIIERRTDKSGKEYYYNTETKKRTSKEEFEKQKPIEKTEEVKPKEVVKQVKPKEEVRGKSFEDEVAREKENIDLAIESAKLDKNKQFEGASLDQLQKDKAVLESNPTEYFARLSNRMSQEFTRTKDPNAKFLADEYGRMADEGVKKFGDKNERVGDIVELKSTPTEKVETKVEKPVKDDLEKWAETQGIVSEMKTPKGEEIKSNSEWYYDNGLDIQSRKIFQVNTPYGKDITRGQKLRDGRVKKFNETNKENYIKYVEEELKAGKTLDKNSLEDYTRNKFGDKNKSLEWVKENTDKIKPEVLSELTNRYPDLQKVKTETKVDANLNPTIAKLREEALREFKENQTTNVGFSPLAYKNQIKYGTALLKEGAVKFADWSQRMIKDLGEKIKPQLLRIWNEIKKFGEDLGKIAVDKIGEFVESKYNPARPLKAIEGDFLGKDNPLVKQLNEKVSPESPIAKQTGKTEITPRDESVRKLRTANYYQNLLGRELVGKERSEIKTTLKESVKENPNRIKYNIFTPSNLGKDMNPLIKGAYQLLFDKREQFKKDFENFTQTTNKLIRESRRSRSKFELVREDKQVIDFLEGKIKQSELTPQEIKLANYLKDWFKQAEPIMTNKNARDNYVTHVKRGFLETWKQEGFWDGAKSLFKETDKNWESQIIADIDLMMAKEKFNPFAITRKGGMPYSRDLGKILETYGKIFFLKTHFDNVRPQINILNNLLGKEGMTKEKNFLKRYAKKMTGENIDNLTPEALRRVSSALMKFTGLRFLAWNLPAGVINTAAGFFDNLINIPIKEWKDGNFRFETKQGQKIIRDNNVVDVENLDAAIGLRQQIGKAIDMALFLPMRGGWKLPWGEHYIQGSAYLGMLTKQEFQTGRVSLERHREILEKIGNIHGAYRDNLAPDAKQTIGTREALQFKLWMFAKVRNRWERYGSGLAKPLLKGDFENIKPENLRSIAKELALVGSAILVATDDDSPLKEPIQDILSDLYGVFNPSEMAGSLRRGIPAVGTLVDLYDLVEAYFTQEVYKTSNKKYGIKKGDLKAPKKLERLIPLYRQYKKYDQGTPNKTGMPELDLPEIQLPEIQ